VWINAGIQPCQNSGMAALLVDISISQIHLLYKLKQGLTKQNYDFAEFCFVFLKNYRQCGVAFSPQGHFFILSVFIC